MRTTIKIVVFQGDHPELLPNMCMFCATPLVEDQYQKVVMRVRDGLPRPVPLPVCERHRIPETLHADDEGLDPMAGGSIRAGAQLFGVFGAVVGGVIAARLEERKAGKPAFFTISDVHRKFADELERLRNLAPKEYGKLMEKADKAFAEKIIAFTDPTADQKRQEKEQQQALDEQTFALQGAAGRGQVSSEVARSSSMKFLIASIIVGVISLMLLICIAGSLIGYVLYNRKPAETDVADKGKVLNKPVEQLAKIKVIDGEQQTIKLLMKTNTHKTFKFTNDTIFFDKAGARLAGVDALKIDEYCVILPTADDKGLQWLKMSDPP